MGVVQKHDAKGSHQEQRRGVPSWSGVSHGIVLGGAGLSPKGGLPRTVQSPGKEASWDVRESLVVRAGAAMSGDVAMVCVAQPQ